MDNTHSIRPLLLHELPLQGAPRQKDSPEKLAESARQFESLLIAQMLRQMRECSGEGWMGTGEEQAGMRMMEVAEDQLAQALSAQGGLGLARMITESLAAARVGPQKVIEVEQCGDSRGTTCPAKAF